MNRKGPWEGYRRCLLPAFFCAHIFIKRETSGYEGDVLIWGTRDTESSRVDKNTYTKQPGRHKEEIQE